MQCSTLPLPSGKRPFEGSSIFARATMIFCATILLLAMNNTAFCQDQSAMPWVDDAGQALPYGLKERHDSVTKDRDSVKVAPVPTAAAGPVNSAQYDWGFLTRPVLIWLFVTAMVCIIGLMVWLFLSARLDDGGGISGREYHGRTIEESIKQLPFELDENFGDFREQALAAYRAGDLKKSLILLFSHVLVTLDQKNLVHLKKGKTNRQYLRELKPHPQLAGYYGDVMVPFEQTFFGDYPAEKAVCEQCWNGLDKFQANVESAKIGGHG